MNSLCRFVSLSLLGICSQFAKAQRIPAETRTTTLVLTGELAGVRDVKALKDGRFFALTDSRVHAYDSKGALIRRFEGKASVSTPPLANPVALDLTDSTVTIRDLGTRRLSAFKLDGTYIAARFMPNADEREARWQMRGGATIVERSPDVPFALDSLPKELSLERAVRLQSGSTVNDLFRIRIDTAYFRPSRDSVFGLPDEPRALRNSALLARPVATRFGSGGAWAMSGDSLIAHVDGQTGFVRWYSINGAAATLVDSARLARPVRRVTPEDVGEEARRLQRLVASRAPRGAAAVGSPTRPLLLGAPSVWSVATKAFFSKDGALWVGVNRIYVDAADSAKVLIGDDNTWTVFPRTGPAFIVTLRALFRLTDVVGDRLYGFVDTGGEHPEIQVYSLKKR